VSGGITDQSVLHAVTRIRDIIDKFRSDDPVPAPGGERAYLTTYEELQASYAAVLTAARRRGLPIPPWEGDDLIFSPLVDKWVRLRDHL
jgi:hypothetical protein